MIFHELSIGTGPIHASTLDNYTGKRNFINVVPIENRCVCLIDSFVTRFQLQFAANYYRNVFTDFFSVVAFTRISKTIELTKLWTTQFAFPSKVAYDKVSSVLARL